MDGIEVHEYDVLVIGAGGAGLRAALEVSAAGLSVGVVSKSLLGKAHTVMAEGGIAAAIGATDPEDSTEVHFKDTMRSAKFINDWKTVDIFTREAPDRVLELEGWGALFDRDNGGRPVQRPFGAHTYRRLVHVGDRTGLEIIRTLQEHDVEKGIAVHTEVIITSLLQDDHGRPVGAFGFLRSTGEFVVFSAKAIILATGGMGKIYKVTSNSWECTGAGFALAYHVGADLRDMEMVQFHPTGMVFPAGVKGLLVTEAVRGEGGRLFNSEGEHFMERYDPQKLDLSSRDVVARSIYTEVKAGRGSPHGGVYLDITHRDAEYIKRKLPSMYMQFMELADVDITKERMEVGPTTHYMMGGIAADAETCATNVPGLFACGEAASGLHGANRLGGNSLGDLLVFGRRAGIAAAEYVKGNGTQPRVNEAAVRDHEARMLKPFKRESGENAYTLHHELQELMHANVGIAREHDDLAKAVEGIGSLRERLESVSLSGSRSYNPGLNEYADLHGMLDVAEAITRAALERKESRGAHLRVDFPDRDPEWLKKNVIITKGKGGQMELSTRKVDQMPEKYRNLFDDGEVY